MKNVKMMFAAALALGALACSEPVVEEVPVTTTPEVVVPTPEPVVPVVPEDPNSTTETKTDASI